MADGPKTADRDDVEEATYDTLRVCVNFRAGDMLPSCGARGSKELAAALDAAQPDAAPNLKIQKVHCLGRCHLGPALRLSPRGPHLVGVAPSDAQWVLDRIAVGDVAALVAAYPDPLAEERG
ncbi:MAG: (2Fe-2S) ferredoxin domain-containing protein [Marivibrio sp.]|uniref:(2Fe-2S) ferredoxin domain-containing protein n=1 Tax=Marivibrio sp. TaxID=2039719 RepID=UPI0032EADBBB